MWIEFLEKYLKIFGSVLQIHEENQKVCVYIYFW